MLLPFVPIQRKLLITFQSRCPFLSPLFSRTPTWRWQVKVPHSTRPVPSAPSCPSPGLLPFDIPVGSHAHVSLPPSTVISLVVLPHVSSVPTSPSSGPLTLDPPLSPIASLQLKFVKALHSDPYSAELIVQEIVDIHAKDSSLVCCAKAGTWSHMETGLCFHTRWNIFSKWVSDDDIDEREFFYWLIDDELILRNNGEFCANNEAILATSDQGRKFNFLHRAHVFCP